MQITNDSSDQARAKPVTNLIGDTENRRYSRVSPSSTVVSDSELSA